MKFIVSRTSGGDTKPIEEAKIEHVEKWHTRTCDEETYNEKFSAREGEWRSKGTNHSVTEAGYITRQEDDVEEWVINITTFEELIGILHKYGDIVMINKEYGRSLPGIEIYDDYRE
jgi:hypothetical protein